MKCSNEILHFREWINLISEDEEFNAHNTPKLFHISFRDDLEGKWTPQKPEGEYDEKYYTSEHPEPDIPRISTSPTIKQCFQAIHANVKHYFEKENYPHMDFHVYTPKLTGKERILTPKELTDKRFVHDAHMTDEHSILDPVHMQLHSKIRIYNTNRSKMLNYKPFGDENTKERPFAPAQIRFKTLKKYHS